MRVLVVDDEPDIRELLVDDIQNAGYVAREMENGFRALETAVEFRPHVILLDLMMPIIDGFEVLVQLKADPRTASIPVIIASARVTSAVQARARELGATDFMTKPWEDGELVWRNEQAVNKTTELAA